MFRESNRNIQLDMFSEPSLSMCKRATKLYTDPKAWQNQFYELVTSKVDESIFKPMFKDVNNGAPTCSIRAIVGMMVYKAGCGCSDRELEEKCDFDMLLRRALGLLKQREITELLSLFGYLYNWIGYIILFGGIVLFIFAFVSLKMVAFYGNYTIIISKTGQLFSSVMGSIEASVGNLIAEGNLNNTMKVFWEMLTLRHFVAGFLCFVIFHLIEPFISLWLGTEYILPKSILILIVLNNYIGTSRSVVDMFNASHGLFADTWSAWLELGLNVTLTILLGYYWGIAGILLSKVITTSTIAIFWKPYYLFHSGFYLDYKTYWNGASRNFLTSAASFILAHFAIQYINIAPTGSYFSWILYSLISVSIYVVINITLIMLLCKGSKDFYHRIVSLIR